MKHGNQVNDHLTAIENLSLLGGRLCLDFANTVDSRMDKHSDDFLTGYSDLVRWGRLVGVLTDDEEQNLLCEAEQHPLEATATFGQAIVLREVIYRVFSEIARGTVPQTEDLEALRSAITEVMVYTRIASTPDGFTWHWVKREGAFDRMLWPVVGSAIELLTSEEVKKVKECPGVGDCGWLFLDTSKNGSRQWCSMEDCGSRAKMRRQYARKRAGSLRSADQNSSQTLH